MLHLSYNSPFQFQIIEKHVDTMLQNLPGLSEECEKVTKQAQEINSRYNISKNQIKIKLLSLVYVPLKSIKIILKET